MRNSFQTLIAALLLIGGSQSASAQMFSTMGESQRNAQLTQIALKVYKHKMFSKYYANYGYCGKSEIATFNRGTNANDKKDVERSSYLGLLQYKVTLYCKPGTNHGSFPIARVYVSDKSGKAWFIRFGNDNMAFPSWNYPDAFK